MHLLHPHRPHPLLVAAHVTGVVAFLVHDDLARCVCAVRHHLPLTFQDSRTGEPVTLCRRCHRRQDFGPTGDITWAAA